MEPINENLELVIVASLLYFEILFQLNGIKICLLKFFLNFHKSKKKYFEKLVDKNAAEKIFCKVKNVYYHKSDPKKLSISNLLKLISLIKNIK